MPIPQHPTRSKFLSRYNYGVMQVQHKGVTTTTTVGTPYFDNFDPVGLFPGDYKVVRLPVQYSHRPDLVSYAFYNTPGYWWYIMQINNITDPFEELISAQPLLLPKP